MFSTFAVSAAFLGLYVLSFNEKSITDFRSESVMIKKPRHNLPAESSLAEIAYVEKLAASFNSSWIEEPEVIAALNNLTEGTTISLPDLGRVKLVFTRSNVRDLELIGS